jgi:hypothetical protein
MALDLPTSVSRPPSLEWHPRTCAAYPGYLGEKAISSGGKQEKQRKEEILPTGFVV